MSGFREFKYSIIIFIIGLITTSFIFIPSYWLFNIHPFPPKFGLDIWIILILVLLIPAYFIEIKLIKNFKLSKKREGVIILSSLFCIVMINFSMMDFMKNNYQTTKIISSVNEIYNSKSPKLIIKNFEILTILLFIKIFALIKDQDHTIYSFIFYILLKVNKIKIRFIIRYNSKYFLTQNFLQKKNRWKIS